MNSLTKVFLLFLILFLSSSCNSRIGLGTSYNKGDLLLESKEGEKQGIGYFVEYKWQHMMDRNGIGIDYNISYRGYLARYKEGGDGFLQSVQFKYYYTLIRPRFNPVRLDIAAGLGFGDFVFLSKTKATPFLANIGADIYFYKSQLIYITPKFGYIKNLHDPTLNLSVELSAGFYFGGSNNY